MTAGFWRRTARWGFGLYALTSLSAIEPGDDWDIVRTMCSALMFVVLMWLPDVPDRERLLPIPKCGHLSPAPLPGTCCVENSDGRHRCGAWRDHPGEWHVCRCGQAFAPGRAASAGTERP